MTRRLENLFDLPPSSDMSEDSAESSAPEEKVTTEQHQTALAEINTSIDKIDAALPAIQGLDTSDKELDELADLAKQSFQDLSDLGMQVDSRYSSEIFSVASNMLGHAITAKNAKLNKKLKMIELQLRKAKLDQDSDTGADIPTATGSVIDRNELLRRLTADNNTSSDSSQD